MACDHDWSSWRIISGWLRLHSLFLHLLYKTLKRFFEKSVNLSVFLYLAQQHSNDSTHTSFIMVFSRNPQSLISLLLLGLSVVLSGSIYLWVLRFVCIGCCQPVTVSAETEALVAMVWSHQGWFLSFKGKNDHPAPVKWLRLLQRWDYKIRATVSRVKYQPVVWQKCFLNVFYLHICIWC